jgi:hypothetical protein
MSQQRLAALPALGGTLFLIGWVAVLTSLGAPDSSAPIEAATPQPSTRAEDGRIAFSDRFSDWPGIGAAVSEPRQALLPAAPPSTPDPMQDAAKAAVVESQTPPAPAIASANTPDLVQDEVEAAPLPIEVAALGSAVVPEPQIPLATPPAAFTLASAPDPAQDAVDAAAPLVEVAALGSAVVPEPQMPQLATPSVAIVPSAPDPVQDCDEAAAAPVETAAIENGGAADHPRPPVRLVSLFRPAPSNEDLKPARRPVETPNECLVVQICIDDYLWSFYELTPKVDTNKVVQRIKTTIKKKGKTRTVTRTIVRYVAADFTWKDPIAAQKAGMSLKDYVIGGMDSRFKLKLYHAFRAMEDAGLMPGITSAFRDDYRQAIASGNKAASDSSYHGGSRRGGYGHGLAADIVSVKGETRAQRWVSTVELWKWVDARETELGIGRPYLGRDPPHVGPIDGKEFADKRGGAKAKRAGSVPNKRRPVVVAGNPGGKNSAPKAGPVRVGSL